MIEVIRVASDPAAFARANRVLLLRSRQTGKLDWTYIDDQLSFLAELKEEPEILVELQERRQEFER